eukprot:365137-Chlamydomonas_euryale.AAC.1
MLDTPQPTHSRYAATHTFLLRRFCTPRTAASLRSVQATSYLMDSTHVWTLSCRILVHQQLVAWERLQVRGADVRVVVVCGCGVWWCVVVASDVRPLNTPSNDCGLAAEVVEVVASRDTVKPV